eukprot:scaffold256084_cov75-Attheya_sp.AAC.1
MLLAHNIMLDPHIGTKRRAAAVATVTVTVTVVMFAKGVDFVNDSPWIWLGWRRWWWWRLYHGKWGGRRSIGRGFQ